MVPTSPTQETTDGLEEFCNCSATKGRCDRARVRTFVDRSLHIKRRRGSAGTSHARRQSHEFYHAQRCLLQRLAPKARTAHRLYARLAIESENLPRGM